ncbi:hypothetical protein L345_16003, partial [Ophiophagus hannah]
MLAGEFWELRCDCGPCFLSPGGSIPAAIKEMLHSGQQWDSEKQPLRQADRSSGLRHEVSHHFGYASLSSPSPFFHSTGSPRLITVHLVAIRSYNGTEKGDSRPFLTVMAVTASLWSRDLHLEA